MVEKIFELSHTERVWIESLLKKRLKSYEDWTKENHKTEVSKKRFRKRFTSRYITALKKTQNNYLYYNSGELLAIKSCVKDFFNNSCLESKQLCEEILKKI